MNELYYEQIASEIEDLDEIDDEEISVIEDETEKPAEVTEPENVPTTTKKPVVSIDYTKYYVGNISIPKIDLKRGFVSKDSKYNNVNRNIYIVFIQYSANVVFIFGIVCINFIIKLPHIIYLQRK